MKEPESSKSPTRLSIPSCEDAQKKLTSILPILEAFNHRHCNQHSASHWWKAFNILRRHVRKLCENLSRVLRYQGRKQERYLAMVFAQSHHLAHVVLPQSYPAITQLVADNQHAALGVALMAALAGVHSALNMLLGEPETANAKIVHDKQHTQTETEQAEANTNNDKGITISRSQFQNNPGTSADRKRKAPSTAGEESEAPASAAESKAKDKPEKKKKKKAKKGGDAFSSLFGSL